MTLTGPCTYDGPLQLPAGLVVGGLVVGALAAPVVLVAAGGPLVGGAVLADGAVLAGAAGLVAVAVSGCAARLVTFPRRPATRARRRRPGAEGLARGAGRAG